MSFLIPWLEKHGANAIVFFLSVLTLINPVAHTTTVREICFYGSVLLYLAVWAAKPKEIRFVKTPLFVPTILFVGWVCIGLIFALDRSNSWHDIYSYLFKYTVLAVLLASFFDTTKKVRLLSWLIILSLVTFLCITLVKYYLVNDNSLITRFYGNSEGMTFNLISIPIIFSCFLLYCNLFETKKVYVRLLSLLLYIPLLSALVSTQTRSAFIALAVSSLFFVFFYRKKWALLLIAVLAVIACFTPFKKRFSVNLIEDPRVAHALLVFEVIKEHPVVGIGFGMETFGKRLELTSYKDRVEDTYKIHWGEQIILTDPHCLYTDILVRTGVVGFGLFITFVSSLFKMLWTVGKSANESRCLWGLGMASSLLAFLIIGFFEPVFSHVQVYYLTLMISFVSILWRQESLQDTVLPKSCMM